MPDTFHPDPAVLGLPSASTISPELGIDAVNMTLALALLSDGTTVPIVRGEDRDGDECGLCDDGLYCFVCGSDWTGWWWRFAAEFNFLTRVH